MKKAVLLSLILSLGIHVLPAFAEGRNTQPAAVRPMAAFGRGLLNIGGLPFEVSSTLVREVKAHHWLWPISYPFRLGTNVATRFTSGFNDITVVPFVSPFSNDVKPITEGIGLPNYPWQIET